MNRDDRVIGYFRSMSENIRESLQILNDIFGAIGLTDTGACVNDLDGNRISNLFTKKNQEYYYNKGDRFLPVSSLGVLGVDYVLNNCESNYSHTLYVVDQGNGGTLPAAVDPGAQYIDINIINMNIDLDITTWVPTNIKDGTTVTIFKKSTDVVYRIYGTFDGNTYEITKYSEFIHIQWSEVDNKFSILEH